jgi:chromosomal replication initiator protein
MSELNPPPGPDSTPNLLRQDKALSLAPEALWNECLTILKGRVNSQSFKTWIEPIAPARIEGAVFFMTVPSQFFSEWLEEHYFSLINEVLTMVSGREYSIEYIAAADEREPVEISVEAPNARTQNPFDGGAAAGLEPQRPQAPPQVTIRPPLSPTINPRYTFSNYIKGESNQFARAAALAVANNPSGTSFNPLVIYGGVGLGKTHLVHAIGNHLLATGNDRRVLYISSEKFTVDFVEAIQRDTVTEFSTFYRSVDLLIVDDIQFLAGKEKTQDIFFHTFNTLHHLGKQIVLSSDRPPKELKGLNERLISRFQWGLTADIQPPDLETRIAILMTKSGDDGIELPHDVLEFIATNVTSNIRELEGCLISLLARASMESRPVDLALARDVVRSIVGEVRTHLTIEEIQRVVCAHMGIPEDLIRAKTRRQEIVNARQIAMYLSKELTNSSLKTIGLHFGGRDHSTVIHAYQTVEDGMKVDPKQKVLVDQLKSKLTMNIR